MKCVLDTATIDWEEHGDGRPILFLHGWTMNRRLEVADYEPIFAKQRGWRRIYPDRFDDPQAFYEVYAVPVASPRKPS